MMLERRLRVWGPGLMGLVSGGALALSVSMAPAMARACGGCFHPVGPTETQQVVTDHRMVMAIHASESILWDQIRYAGSPTDFAWILPVSGSVQVDVASGDFFDTLDSQTAPVVNGPVPLGCPNAGQFGFASASGLATPAEDRGVQVIHTAVIGPYSTVTLRSTDAMALTTWLAMHSYVIPPSIAPVIQAYTDLHMDFVAVRLLPGQGVNAMQPIRITYASSNVTLPLRMVAAGVDNKVGITLFVIGEGRYEAQNAGNGTIDASQLRWDYNTNASNYPTVFETALRGLGGRAWITEFAGSQPGRFGSFNYSFSAAGQAEWTLATTGLTNPWVTRLRTDLLATFLDRDLQLAASLGNDNVSNVFQVNAYVGTPPSFACVTDDGFYSGTDATHVGAGVTCSATPWTRGNVPGHRRALALGGLLAGLALASRHRRRA